MLNTLLEMGPKDEGLRLSTVGIFTKNEEVFCDGYRDSGYIVS